MNPFRAQRMQALAGGTPAVRPAGRFRAELTTDGAADLWLYDVIDPWGGYWGISAAEIVQALQGVSGGVTVHVNSPGGDVFEAIAMHANFAAHPGNVTMIVEGHAASAASMVITAANRVEVVPNAQVMIHDAWSFEAGDAAAMRKTADLLDRTSQNIATMYQAKAGGEAGEWRALMQATTWYVGAEEIIASGLADAVVSAPAAAEQQPSEAFAKWDLSIYGKAPEPREVTIDAKIMRPPPLSPDEEAALQAEVGPEFGNRFAALLDEAGQIYAKAGHLIDTPAPPAAGPEFGNKFREALKELTT